MIKTSDLLGMNARDMYYTKQNSSQAKKYTISKLAAKDLLKTNQVPVAELYAKFDELNQVSDYDFKKIDSSFVIKPVGGNAGKGILIIKKKVKDEDIWIGVKGERYSEDDLKLHIHDILEGQYSTYGTTHTAFVEERVPINPTFKKYVYRGTPDVRVIVYNKVPVMAMLRLPTEESEGRANLHQGAIGVGIDIASGVTLRGVLKGKIVRYIPGTKRKLNGIKIPKWTSLLKTAVFAAEVSGLRYGGIDVFVHPEKGPMIVELNANPGLEIQIANQDGLRRRLERVEGLKIRNVDHGVRVGKALFAEWFADKVAADEGLAVIESTDEIEIKYGKKKWKTVEAKVDTVRLRSQIDYQLADSLGLITQDTLLWNKKKTRLAAIEAKLRIKNNITTTVLSLTQRPKSTEKVVLGRRDVQGLLIKPLPPRSRR